MGYIYHVNQQYDKTLAYTKKAIELNPIVIKFIPKKIKKLL